MGRLNRLRAEIAKRNARPLTQGDRFGVYEVIDFVEAGGMGAVYRVRQPGFDRVLGLKILGPIDASDESNVDLFSREARITGKLQHPYILPVHDMGEARLPSGALVPYYTMRWLKGGSLATSWITRGADLERDLPVIERVVEALATAHARGIVHRDVKPANIFLDDGQVLLGDWGLAGETGEAEAQSPKASTEVECHNSKDATARGMGTPSYASPEQAEGAKADPRMDVYAVGVLLAEAMSLKPGDGSAGARTTLRERVQTRFQLTNEEDPRCHLASVTTRCLAEAPLDRPASCGELLKEFKKYRRLEQEQREKAIVISKTAALQKRSLRWELSAALLSALAAIGALVTYIWIKGINGDLVTQKGNLANANDALKFEKTKSARETASSLITSAHTLIERGQIGQGMRTLEGALQIAENPKLQDPELSDYLLADMQHWRRKLHRAISAVKLTDEVMQVCFAQGGKLLGYACKNGDAGVLSYPELKPVSPAYRHEGGGFSVALSEDGKYLAVGGYRKGVRVWNCGASKQPPEPVRFEADPEFGGTDGYIRTMTFSKDGQWLFSGGQDGFLRRWNLSSHDCFQLPLIKGLRNPMIEALSLNRTGDKLLVAYQEGAAFIHDPKTLQYYQRHPTTGFPEKPGKGTGVFHVLIDHAKIGSAGWNNAGNEILLSTNVGKTQIIDLDKMRYPLPAELPGTHVAAARSWDDRWLLVASAAGKAAIWDGRDVMSEAGDILEHPEGIYSATFHPSKLEFVTAGRDHCIRSWELQPYRNTVFPLKQQDMFSPSLNRVLKARGLPTLPELDSQRETDTNRLSAHRLVDGGRKLVCGYHFGFQPGAMQGWNPETSKEATPLRVSESWKGPIKTLATDVSGDIAFAGGDFGNLMLWKLKDDAEPLRIWNTRKGKRIRSVALTDAGTMYAFGDDEGLVEVGRVEKDGEPKLSKRMAAGVECVKLGPDGKFLLVALNNQQLKCIRVDDGEVRDLSATSHTAVQIAFEKGSKRFAVGCLDGFARMYEIRGKEIVLASEPMRHDAAVQSMAFSPDGTFLVTGSHDKTARCWHVPDGQPLGPVFHHPESILQVAVSEDGTVTTMSSSILKRWPLPPALPKDSKERQAILDLATRIIPIGDTRGDE